MKKIMLSLMFIVLFCSFVSAQNRIFSGEFNDTYFDVTPLTPSHVSVEAYSPGNSSFYVSFYPSNKKYYVSADNLYPESGINYFYFIANIPEKTQKINFYNNNNHLYTLNTNSGFQLSNFNIAYNNSILNFSWNADLDNYYASIYYNKSGLWNLLLFESWFNNSYELNIPLEELYLSGYHKFKLVVSDGFNEAESYSWFNIPYISWCNGSDFNHDSIVDSADYIALKRNFGNTGATPSMGDINGDGNVDYADLQTLQNNMGMSNCNQAIFPEIPVQLLAEATAEKLATSESSSSGNSGGSSGSSSISSGTITSNKKTISSQVPITSNTVKSDNSNQKTTTKESKSSSFTKIIAKVVEMIKKVASSILAHTKK